MSPELVLERAQWLIRSQAKRVELQEEMSKLFRLDWNDGALAHKPDWVMEIKDPQPFNSMQWLVDVLAHDEPTYRIEIPEEAMLPGAGTMIGDVMGSMGGAVPGMGGGQSAADLADRLESMVKEVYRANDERQATSMQRDELYSAFVQGMIVNKIADLRLSPKWGKYAIANEGASPFYLKAVTPSQIYYEYDEYGVCEVMHRYMRPLKEVVRLYGGSAVGLSNVKADAADGMVRFCEYWTEEVTAKWIEQIYYQGDVDENYFTNETISGGYFVEKPKANVLGFIPYNIKVARGSAIFNRTEQIYPHLYAIHKSKLSLRNNLFFTVAATLAFMLVNPQWTQETNTPENPVQLDFSRPAVHGIRPGEKITPLEMRITPEFKEVMTLFTQRIEESTVSKVVAGQSPGGVTAASGINLLMGGGKLTVSGVQKAMGEVRSGAVQNILRYIRVFPQFAGADSSMLRMYSGARTLDIDPAGLPGRISVMVKYEPFMPQDKALAVQTWLTPLLHKLISSDFFYEQVGVTDSVTLRRQIEQDKNRELADMQFQQQMAMPTQDPNAQAQGQGTPPAGEEMGQGAMAEDMGMGEQPLEQVAPNPQVNEANPATMLNQMMAAIENPMSE